MSSLDLSVELVEFFDAPSRVGAFGKRVWVCVAPLKVNYTCPSAHSSVNWF